MHAGFWISPGQSPPVNQPRKAGSLVVYLGRSPTRMNLLPENKKPTNTNRLLGSRGRKDQKDLQPYYVQILPPILRSSRLSPERPNTCRFDIALKTHLLMRLRPGPDWGRFKGRLPKGPLRECGLQCAARAELHDQTQLVVVLNDFQLSRMGPPRCFSTQSIVLLFFSRSQGFSPSVRMCAGFII